MIDTVGSISLVVEPEQDGLRLDQYLASILSSVSRSQIQRLIRDEKVRAPVRHLRPSTPVRAGMTVVVEIPPAVPATPEPEDLPLPILYDDADVVVVNKPAGMVVHPAAGHARGTLVNALLHHVTGLSGIGGEARPGIVHRLDRGTSGVMVVAKHDAAHQELSRQFRLREVEKEYFALVWGVVHAGRRIDTPIGRDPKHRQKMSGRARHARTAATRVTGAEHLRGISLLQVAIATGRTHQIRVHLSEIGHPIVGDATYGGIRRHIPGDLRALRRLDRPFLHAWRLAFKHPADGRTVEFTAPLPDDLQRILDDVRVTAGRSAGEAHE
jgi:23S rRNA pseudouridine1911/1915/1917 synthase